LIVFQVGEAGGRPQNAVLVHEGPAKKGFGEDGNSYKAWRDVWTGAAKRLRPAAEIVEELARQYAAARQRMCN
jgi:nitronate monooxygenase